MPPSCRRSRYVIVSPRAEELQDRPHLPGTSLPRFSVGDRSPGAGLATEERASAATSTAWRQHDHERSGALSAAPMRATTVKRGYQPGPATAWNTRHSSQTARPCTLRPSTWAIARPSGTRKPAAWPRWITARCASTRLRVSADSSNLRHGTRSCRRPSHPGRPCRFRQLAGHRGHPDRPEVRLASPRRPGIAPTCRGQSVSPVGVTRALGL
jgi:hypothetical protein